MPPPLPLPPSKEHPRDSLSSLMVFVQSRLPFGAYLIRASSLRPLLLSLAILATLAAASSLRAGGGRADVSSPVSSRATPDGAPDAAARKAVAATHRRAATPRAVTTRKQSQNEHQVTAMAVATAAASLPVYESLPHSEFVYGGTWASRRSHSVLDASSAPTPSCHATTLVHLPENRVLMAWFGGTFECAEDVAIYTAIRDADGKWQTPTRVAKVFRNVPYDGKHLPGEPPREGGEPHWNPVLFCPEDVCTGTIHLYFKVGWKIAKWETFVVESNDGGETWTQPVELVPGDHSGGRGPVKNKAIKLADGTWAAPASLETPLKGRRGHQGPGNANQWRAFVDLSTDEGRTWTSTDAIYPTEVGVGVIQPTLWESAPGHVHMLLRSSKDRHRISVWRADSTDSARTWSAPQRTSLPNNNAGLDVAHLPSGLLVLVYNHAREGRYPLRLALSDDNGKTWPVWIDLETEPGEVKGWHEFSYPSIVPWPAGGEEGVSLSYTWHRVRPAFFSISVAELRRRSELKVRGGGAGHGRHVEK